MRNHTVHMTILDIDLDVFVSPAVHCRNDTDPRPSDTDFTVDHESSVSTFLVQQCLVKRDVPGVAFEHHVEVLDKISEAIQKQQLVPPFYWVHVDAHDDFWGHYSKPPNSGNYLYHCIKRNWIEKLVMVFPIGEFSFPDYVLSPDSKIEFEQHSVPVTFSDVESYQAIRPPDFVVLARSPAFTPPKADTLFNSIREHFKS